VRAAWFTVGFCFVAVAAEAGVWEGVRYASGPEAYTQTAKADVTTPNGPGPFAPVFAVHGGSWTGGGRANAAAFCRLIVQAGRACVAVDYRLAPGTRYPGQLDDLRLALRYFFENAGKFGLSRERAILAGESAGAHLVASLALEREPLPFPIAGVLLFSPPVDLVGLAETTRPFGVVPKEVQAISGATGWDEASLAAMRAASPLNAVRAGAPPFLIVQGTADVIVPSPQLRYFCKKLHDSGSECELDELPGAGHSLWEEDRLERFETEWHNHVFRWIDLRIPVH
jgi:alpha-L-fucosidase 2